MIFFIYGGKYGGKSPQSVVFIKVWEKVPSSALFFVSFRLVLLGDFFCLKMAAKWLKIYAHKVYHVPSRFILNCIDNLLMRDFMGEKMGERKNIKKRRLYNGLRLFFLL